MSMVPETEMQRTIRGPHFSREPPQIRLQPMVCIESPDKARSMHDVRVCQCQRVMSTLAYCVDACDVQLTITYVCTSGHGDHKLSATPHCHIAPISIAAAPPRAIRNS
eukprot:1720458-Alexandrium_andersonii.AAC.1